ncbi:MAG TPA: hypothetical protein VK020_00240, partial [Microlunatus sp.]|nr:hypothetical protein [Microlunatus sp.]
MRPQTIRRFLVVFVCSTGIGTLYWVPAVTGSPLLLDTGQRRVVTAEPGGSSQSDPRDARTREAEDRDGESGVDSVPEARRQPVPRTSRQDHAGNSPSTVTGLRTGLITRDWAQISWDAVHSDHDVSYEVRLNGFKVLETGNVVASVRWFNDDMATQVIQVRAVAGSAAGPWSNALVVNPAQPKQTRSTSTDVAKGQERTDSAAPTRPHPSTPVASTPPTGSSPVLPSQRPEPPATQPSGPATPDPGATDTDPGTPPDPAPSETTPPPAWPPWRPTPTTSAPPPSVPPSELPNPEQGPDGILPRLGRLFQKLFPPPPTPSTTPSDPASDPSPDPTPTSKDSGSPDPRPSEPGSEQPPTSEPPSPEPPSPEPPSS